MELPLAIIGSQNEVRVQVGSWLAYTKQARKEELKELFRIGAIDQKSLLEHLEFADISGILERSRTERLLDVRAGSQSEAVMRQTGAQMTDEELATAENELMLEGKDQPVEPDDDHEVHLGIHREAMDDRRHGDLVRAHVNEHVAMTKWINLNRLQTPQPGAQPGMPGGQGPAMASTRATPGSTPLPGGGMTVS
jgi:hypothetical protein